MHEWNRSLSLLLEGNYEEGWPRHDWIRTGRPEVQDRFEPTPTFGRPVWQGDREPITLLVNADFGMGDTIHFWRFMGAVKDRVAHVVLRGDEDFAPLFQGVTLVSKEDPLPDFDKIIHMMAIPRALGVRRADISGRPYLQPTGPPHPSVASLRATKFDKIGVCWGGNPFNPRDGLRSVQPELFDRLGVRLFSLNKLGVPPPMFYDVRGFMGNWNETAHQIQSMDLVISVDTAVAHLAGAMGTPVWVMIPKEPDWRWGEEGDTTLWYDSMRLFRQTTDWAGVVDSITFRLKGLAGESLSDSLFDAAS